MNSEKPLLLAIDPGRVKCGVAVVACDSTVSTRSVVPTEALCAKVKALLAECVPVAVIVGCGTGCKEMIRRIEQAALPLPVYEVEEAHTSEEARRRWVKSHPPKGLQRLMPQSLRCPDAPYDDWVAVILAERWWAQNPAAHSLQNETTS